MLATLIFCAVMVPMQPLDLLPKDVQSATIFVSPERFASDLGAFCSTHKQRTLATLLAQFRQQSHSLFGIDLLDEEALRALQLPQQEPLALVWMPESNEPLLAVGPMNPQVLATTLGKALAGKYTQAKIRQVVLADQNVFSLTVGDGIMPRLYCGSAQGRTFIAGATNRQALGQALASITQSTQHSWPKTLVQAFDAATQAQLLVMHRDAVAGDGAFAAAAMEVTAARLRVSHALCPTHEARAVCQASEGQHDVAVGLLKSLQQKRLALAHGADLSADIALALAWVHPNRGPYRLAPPALLPQAAPQKLLQPTMRMAQQLQQALGNLHLPYALALYPKPAAATGAPWRERLDFVAIMHATDAPQRKELQQATQKLLAMGKPAQSLQRKRPADQGANATLQRRMRMHGVEVDVIATQDTLLAFTAEWAAPKLLHALDPPKPATLSPSPAAGSGCNAIAALHLQAEGIAQVLQRAVIDGAHDALGHNAVAQGLPQLLLAGPAGDLMREFGALVTVDSLLRCDGEVANMVFAVGGTEADHG